MREHCREAWGCSRGAPHASGRDTGTLPGCFRRRFGPPRGAPEPFWGGPEVARKLLLIEAEARCVSCTENLRKTVAFLTIFIGLGQPRRNKLGRSLDAHQYVMQMRNSLKYTVKTVLFSVFHMFRHHICKKNQTNLNEKNSQTPSPSANCCGHRKMAENRTKIGPSEALKGPRGEPRAPKMPPEWSKIGMLDVPERS